MSRANALPLPRRVVIAFVVIAGVGLMVNYPRAVADLLRLADANASQSYDDREIAGGNSVIPDGWILYASRALIPVDAEYEVVLGEPSEGWSELTAAHAAGYLRYFLMPRRQSPGADWVVCINCDRREVEGSAVWEGEDGLSVLRRSA